MLPPPVPVARPLRLGIIGLSEGNGHPYSWSAICNGYDPEAMASCPFPVIPRYLAEREWPAASLAGEASVTHVWTQDRTRSEHIARASYIPAVVGEPEAMLGEVDGLLLARDDAEHHLAFAGPFLRAGLPVYVDKPLALSPEEAEALLALESAPGRLFSCTALRYAPELVPSPAQLAALGPLERIEGVSPKAWDRYAIHVIEPAVALLHSLGVACIVAGHGAGDLPSGGRRLELELRDGPRVELRTTGEQPSPIALRLHGRGGELELVFRDSFNAFRGALAAFLTGVRSRAHVIPREQTRDAVRLLSLGR